MNQQYVMHSLSLNSVSIDKMLTKIHYCKVLTQALTDIPYKTENLDMKAVTTLPLYGSN